MAHLPPVRERDVLTNVLDYLARRQIVHWRNQTGALRNPAGQLVRFGAVGSADVLAILAPAGRVLAIECKGTGGTVSSAQHVFLAAIEAAGGIALVVYPETWLELLEQATSSIAHEPTAFVGSARREPTEA